ncbi:hypothetical protein [uncultured Lamprocystis sp.]|uniref:hypothetical protein n=1 Tax=uncultured Lamprocystis sp. TaxID=543132 RepID=UPI0025D0EC54|nr:hypothetical protein [uncultured Lamprocystis sp.]
MAFGIALFLGVIVGGFAGYGADLDSEQDLSFYADRLSCQMLKIAKVGQRIESYLPKAYQRCANRNFIEDALNAFKSVGGAPGDAALEIYRDIDKDIQTMQLFLSDWENSSGIDKKIYYLGKELYLQLLKLKEFIADTPPDMMAACKEIVIEKRGTK